MEKKNIIPEAIMEKIKKYPDLEESVNTYLKTLKIEQERNLSLDAVKVLESQKNVKPLEGLFNVSVGADGDVPQEVLDVIRKYPEFEERVNKYLETLVAAKAQNLSLYGLQAMESQADVKAVKLEPTDMFPLELWDTIKKYPDIEEEINSYLKTMEQEKKLGLSIDAVKVLNK